MVVGLSEIPCFGREGFHPSLFYALVDFLDPLTDDLGAAYISVFSAFVQLFNRLIVLANSDEVAFGVIHLGASHWRHAFTSLSV